MASRQTLAHEEPPPLSSPSMTDHSVLMGVIKCDLSFIMATSYPHHRMDEWIC